MKIILVDCKHSHNTQSIFLDSKVFGQFQQLKESFMEKMFSNIEFE